MRADLPSHNYCLVSWFCSSFLTKEYQHWKVRLRKNLLHQHHRGHHHRFLSVWPNVCFILSSLEPRWPLRLEALLVGCSLQALTRQHAVGPPRNALAGRGAEVRAGSRSVYPEASQAQNRVWPILLTVLKKLNSSRASRCCLPFSSPNRWLSVSGACLHYHEASPHRTPVLGLTSSSSLPALHLLLPPLPASLLLVSPSPSSTTHPLVTSWPFNGTYPSLGRLEYSFCPRLSGISQRAFHPGNALHFFLLFFL